MRVCKHGCDINIFLLFTPSSWRHWFEKKFELKTRQVYFIYTAETWKINFFCLHGKPLFCKTRTDYMSKTLCTRLRNWWEFISLLISAITKSFMFFLGKLIYKSNRKLFSCICIAWYKHSRGWEKSRPFCKPSTLSRVCVTVLNSPNPSHVSIRLCKHGKCFLLLKVILKKIWF